MCLQNTVTKSVKRRLIRVNVWKLGSIVVKFAVNFSGILVESFKAKMDRKVDIQTENLMIDCNVRELHHVVHNKVDLGEVLKGLEDIKRKIDPKGENEESAAELRALLEKSEELLASLPDATEKRKEFKPKSRLRQSILLEETSEELLKKGEYDQAYGILASTQELSESGTDLWFLFQYWGNLMVAGGRDAEAKQVHEKIIATVRDELKSDHDEAYDLAKSIQEDKKYFDSTLMFLIADDLLRVPLTVETASDKFICLSNLGNLAETLISKKPLKGFVEAVLVPRGRDMLCEILKTQPGGGLALKLSHVKTRSLHAFEVLLLNANCRKAHIEMGRIALNFLEGHYGENALKQKYYGIISHNLGSSFLHLSLNREAAVMFHQAIECFKVAVDMDDEDEKTNDIRKAEEMIRIHNLELLL